MSLTRIQMATEVLDNLGRASTAEARSGTVLSTRAVSWLNRAQIYFSRKYDVLFKRSTASTVASQQNYSFPSDVNAIYSITIQNGTRSWKLKCVMPWEFDRMFANPSSDSTNQPNFYIPYKSTRDFELYPIPDGVYTLNLRYSYIPADLSSDSSTSDYALVNLNIDDVLIKYATSEGFKYLGELEDAAVWKADADLSAREAMKQFRSSFPDWAPTGKGFSTQPEFYLGDYWNNPFVME